MKKLILFLSFISIELSFLNFLTSSNFANALSETTTYAKAGVNCTLYKSQTLANNVSNIYFIVPETYFVIVLDKISDECTKVQYGKFVGFVDSSTITIATFLPIVKTLENITLDIKETSGTQIWNYPDTSSSILTTISAGAKNINYIAACYGTIPSGGDSNLWFYVSFTPNKNSTNVYEGYIYSENTTNLSEIVANAETNPEIIDSTIDGENLLFLSSTFKTIVIIIIAIPVTIFLLIIMYKTLKKFKEYTIKQKSKQTENIDINSQNQSNNSQNFYVSDISQPENLKHNLSLKANLEQMKDMKLVKKHETFGGNKSYPTFPDYNPEDDIL